MTLRIPPLLQLALATGFGWLLSEAFPPLSYDSGLVRTASWALVAAGIVVSLTATVWTPPEALRSFLIAGVLSSFTTFSAFSLDVINLLEREQYLYMTLYYLGSVTLSIAAILMAVTLVRGLVS